MDFQKGQTWFGKSGTSFDGVEAKVDDITRKYVQLSFNKIVHYRGMYLGEIGISKSSFYKMFEPYEQLHLF